jgi:hypothetical protein
MIPQGHKGQGTRLSAYGGSFRRLRRRRFRRHWDPEIAAHDDSTPRSRHGYFIIYAGCPILWASQMQTEIALSSTEIEFIGISCALRTATPMMESMKELLQQGFNIRSARPQVHCRVFEDNSGALEIAKVQKMRPRTKHINIKYHHFRGHVARGEVSRHAISTDDMPADMLTKPLNQITFERHRKSILGW